MNKPDPVQQVADLEQVLEVSRALGATAELDDLLKMIIDQAMRVLDAERASIFLYDPNPRELFLKVAEGAKEIRFSIDKGVAGAAARNRKTINVPDAYADERFNPEVDRKTGYRTRSILACPLLDYEGELVGVLQVLNKRSGSFSDWDIWLGNTLSAQAGVALQRARLLDHYVEKQQMEKTLELARTIQKDLLPETNPEIPGYEVGSFSLPAEHAGGDCFDFLELHEGCVAFALGDATGHGVGPALISAETRALLRALACMTNDPVEIVNRANRLLTHDLSDYHFVTVFFGVLNPKEHLLRYISAGQGPLLLYKAKENKTIEMVANGIPMGVIDDMEYTEAEPIHFDPGDIFAILTDGFYEYANDQQEQFGVERVSRALSCIVTEPLDRGLGYLHAELLNFAEGHPQDDDLTAILIRRS